MDNLIPLTFNPKGAARENLSILVVGPQLFCDKLAVVLNVYSLRNYNSDIKVKITESIQNFLMSNLDDGVVDYVVILLDTTNKAAITVAESNLKLLEKEFLVGRVCLVNGSSKSAHWSIGKDMCELADNFQIPYINGEINDDESCKYLGKRLLLLVAAASGYSTGLPIIVPLPSTLV